MAIELKRVVIMRVSFGFSLWALGKVSQFVKQKLNKFIGNIVLRCVFLMPFTSFVKISNVQAPL